MFQVSFKDVKSKSPDNTLGSADDLDGFLLHRTFQISLVVLHVHRSGIRTVKLESNISTSTRKTDIKR